MSFLVRHRFVKLFVLQCANINIISHFEDCVHAIYFSIKTCDVPLEEVISVKAKYTPILWGKWPQKPFLATFKWFLALGSEERDTFPTFPHQGLFS